MAHSKKVKITNLPELLIHLGKVYKKKATWDDVDLKSLSVVIPAKVKGRERDERIDYRGATLIKSLQDDADKRYATITDEKLPAKAMIKATSKKGSNILSLDFTEIVKTAIGTMPPEYTLTFLITAALGTVGVSVYKHYVDKEKNRQNVKMIENAIEAMREVSVAALAQGVDVRKNMRKYIHSMGKDEEISIASSPYMKRPEAKSALAPATKRDDITKYTHCDGAYTLLGLSLRGELPELSIAQGAAHAKALFFARVPAAVKDEITRTIDESIENQQPVEMDLHMDCYFAGRRIKHCVILGIGTPRPGMTHYKLGDIPQDVKSRDAMLPGYND